MLYCQTEPQQWLTKVPYFTQLMKAIKTTPSWDKWPVGFAKILRSSVYRMKWTEVTFGDWHHSNSIKSLFDVVKTKDSTHSVVMGIVDRSKSGNLCKAILEAPGTYPALRASFSGALWTEPTGHRTAGWETHSQTQLMFIVSTLFPTLCLSVESIKHLLCALLWAF